MNPLVLDIVGDLSDEDVNFLLAPAQATDKKCKAESLKTVEDVDLVPSAELLHVRILWPGIGWPHEMTLLNVHEANVFHPFPVVCRHIGTHGTSEISSSLAKELSPALEMSAVKSTVSALERKAVVLELDVAAGSEMPGER